MRNGSSILQEEGAGVGGISCIIWQLVAFPLLNY